MPGFGMWATHWWKPVLFVIVAGHFTETTPGHELSARSLDVILREAADVAGVPAIAGAPIGHIGEQWTLPLGAMAELDADARSLHVEAS